jgi:ABC-2 type transport system ATP-binding protein
MVNPAVEVDSLVVDRGRRRVFDGLHLVVEQGTVTGLLGPSGCGKTTLMRCLVGVQRVGSGSVTIAGLPAGSKELRRRIGYVTQAPSVYQDLTVRENLDFFARVLRCGRSARDRAIEQVDLRQHADHLAGRLSGGELSRVSLAVALLAEPDVLILDEPTVGLDPVLRRSLWTLFRQLAEAGATVLVSSHVMDEAERCERLVLMRDGRIIADDTPEAIRRRTGTDDVEGAFLALVEEKTDGSAG